MKTARTVITVAVLLCVASLADGQTPYKIPPADVVKILDAPATPFVRVSPRGDALLLVDYTPHPPISLLARPVLRIAGVRIDPKQHSAQRTTVYTGIGIIGTNDGKQIRVQLPKDPSVGLPAWSYDGKKIAFRRDTPQGVQLWVADARTGEAKQLSGIQLNDVITSPFRWMGDNVHLLAMTVPPGTPRPPEPPPVPVGPIVEETSGKVSRMGTYQDLLKNAFDEQLFEHFATSHLVIVNSVTAKVRTIGGPGIFAGAELSPDGKYLLVTRIKRPFSYRVPFYYFARSTEVWETNGKLAATIADLPVSDEIPMQGVPVGPRNVGWQPLEPATLVWVEALDGGDPTKKVPHRDRVMRLAVPFTAKPAEEMQVKGRFSGMAWTATRGTGILEEYDRDRRWNTSTVVSFGVAGEQRKPLFDLSANDAYNDPGNPVYDVRPDGEAVVAQDGDWVYYSGEGATPKGNRPFLQRVNLVTGAKEELFRAGEEEYEQFVAFASEATDRGTTGEAPAGRRVVITRKESRTVPPNYFVMNLQARTRTPLTRFTDPAPSLTSVHKQLVKYSRPDGVPLSGTLYLPPGYVEGTRLPLVVWAYPLEYSDPGTAGQVRAAPNRFTFYRGTTPLFFLTQGYAVLMDATMPVVGDPETMNNTFVEQIVAAGKAAIDVMDSMGVADPKRVLVMGHSYGAFMTANLLAHCDYFAAGIARSGAYNRSLTPFGFQSERRSFWEAGDVYMKVSPFTYANKINEPILLIHGEADNNTGTFPIQSERMYQALKGNGATARLVILPYESHGYTARESVLHTLAEMFEWGERYVKNRK
jgi:dipeptidyl aminopeptidase/acylaminoacyl peptidase